jgi:hypothetical protein
VPYKSLQSVRRHDLSAFANCWVIQQYVDVTKERFSTVTTQPLWCCYTAALFFIKLDVHVLGHNLVMHFVCL